jgi:hypothetical protein
MGELGRLTSDYPSRSGEARACANPGSRHQAAQEGSLPVRSMLNIGACQGVDIRPNGMRLPDGLSYDSWHELGCQATRVASCSAWWLGDWLVYGEQNYGDRYKQAIADTSLNYQTLRNYVWVARTFPVSRRRDTLSFGHHIEVAALPDDEQDVWLAQAERSNWSRNRLRRELRAIRQTASSKRSTLARSLTMNVPAEQHDRWRSAAEQRNCAITDWIIATLDQAANEALTRDRKPGEPGDQGGGAITKYIDHEGLILNIRDNHADSCDTPAEEPWRP